MLSFMYLFSGWHDLVQALRLFFKTKASRDFQKHVFGCFFFRGSSNNTARKEDVCCTDPSGELRSVASGSAGRRSETCHWVPRCFSVKVMHGSRWDLDQQKYWHPISIIEIRHIYFLTFQIVIPGIKRKREREKNNGRKKDSRQKYRNPKWNPKWKVYMEQYETL